ncbi:hypothetical protein DPEC_G00326870 [Dallia pectoralis]|uniref:Uncharacterized protein n=1 Tax=Dallia pectoralis TaxID=75939 RepID=A0ACC2F7Y6_DALPE|nr:hypothetical protein DPEC_G00326870 [Dallia pectoralis]
MDQGSAGLSVCLCVFKVNLFICSSPQEMRAKERDCTIPPILLRSSAADETEKPVVSPSGGPQITTDRRMNALGEVRSSARHVFKGYTGLLGTRTAPTGIMEETTIPNSSDKYLNEANTCALDLSQDSIYLPVLYGIFFVVGTPLNLMALYGLYRLIKSEHVLPVYVINLLLSDLLQLFTLPLWIDYYTREHSWRFGSASCKLMGVVFYVSIYSSIVFMCVIALERYLAIAKPLKFQHLRKLRFAKWMSLVIWVIVAVPPCIAFQMLNLDGKHSMCIEKYPSERSFVVYRLITLSVTFVLPLSFIFSLYWKTLRAVFATEALGAEEKRRIRGLLSLLVVIFLVVLGPYHITGGVKYVGLLLYDDACQWERSVFLPYQLGRGLLSLNSLLDPVLYTFMRSDFRAAAGRYTSCLRAPQRRVTGSESSSSKCTTGTSLSRLDHTARV